MATTVLPPDLDISASEPLTKAVLDAAFTYIIKRFLVLESFTPEWQQAVDTLNDVGLNRINSALTPVFEAYSEIASLGAIFAATSSSTLPIAVGSQTFIIDAPLRNQFAPARWMSAITTDAKASMAGLVTSYDRASGALVIDIVETYGTGSFPAWQLSPSSPPLLAAAVVDGGVFDAGSAEADSVPFIYAGVTAVTAESDGGTF
jgi:hypothetical protein